MWVRESSVCAQYDGSVWQAASDKKKKIKQTRCYKVFSYWTCSEALLMHGSIAFPQWPTVMVAPSEWYDLSKSGLT